MTLDDLIRESLGEIDGYEPNPDLFARVQSSIAEATADRRRILRWAASIFSLVGLLGVTVAVSSQSVEGDLVMSPVTWELVVTTLLVSVVVALGPLLRRFGRILVEDAFRAHRTTADRFLTLLDVSFYLVFAAYILLTTTFANAENPMSLLALVSDSAPRVAGLLLLMGVLHTVTIFAIPVVGLLFTSSWRNGHDTALIQSGREAARIERTVGFIMWAAIVVGAAGALLLLDAILSIGLGN